MQSTELEKYKQKKKVVGLLATSNENYIYVLTIDNNEKLKATLENVDNIYYHDYSEIDIEKPKDKDCVLPRLKFVKNIDDFTEKERRFEIIRKNNEKIKHIKEFISDADSKIINLIEEIIDLQQSGDHSKTKILKEEISKYENSIKFVKKNLYELIGDIKFLNFIYSEDNEKIDSYLEEQIRKLQNREYFNPRNGRIGNKHEIRKDDNKNNILVRVENKEYFNPRNGLIGNKHEIRKDDNKNNILVRVGETDFFKRRNG